MKELIIKSYLGLKEVYGAEEAREMVKALALNQVQRRGARALDVNERAYEKKNIRNEKEKVPTNQSPAVRELANKEKYPEQVKTNLKKYGEAIPANKRTPSKTKQYVKNAIRRDGVEQNTNRMFPN